MIDPFGKTLVSPCSIVDILDNRFQGFRVTVEGLVSGDMLSFLKD